MASDDSVHDFSKNVDSDELDYFLITLPAEHTEAEKALKQELSSLREMKRALAELVQIRKEEKSRVVVKAGEKAKEQAMELLRSGAIQIEDKKDRHTFKRKPKDTDEEDVVDRVKKTIKEKTSLYANFRKGPKLLPCSGDARLANSNLSSELDLSLEKPKSVDYSSLSNTSSCDAEVAASKRKQQLIALSEDDDEESDQAVNRFDLDTKHVITSARDVDKADNSGPYSRSSETTLYVGYHKVTSDFIYDTFEPIGEVVRVKIGDFQNHAYVTMATKEMADKALQLDHQMVNNRLLRVSYARRPGGNRFRGDQRPFRPSSPKAKHNPNQAYNAVPPHDSQGRQTESGHFEYKDLDNMDD